MDSEAQIHVSKEVAVILVITTPCPTSATKTRSGYPQIATHTLFGSTEVGLRYANVITTNTGTNLAKICAGRVRFSDEALPPARQRRAGNATTAAHRVLPHILSYRQTSHIWKTEGIPWLTLLSS